ncbi:PQQ-binding-like beta-propeller repeat protein [Bizionia myxarmorum]|uniref:PQQ-like beta-propeller repeat protein n=1 Tax=Bizionia myxarmorum TaxID=291186 RepID=A0A5D0RC43_9FLAO|nr:PQQ-binding-like beta-propeller repeat protein [Bizionia myxarmorum]TYB79117.1 PQQ-like beta-propeller repeat protein [Bizionia myxarmorum]
MKFNTALALVASIFLTCKSGKPKVIANLPRSLPEISAIEKTTTSNLFWVIQDAGNNNHVYGLDKTGSIKADITVENAKNRDWEDLTADKDGNLYIGNFGNNDKKQIQFSILKITNPQAKLKKVQAEFIHFSLPDNVKPEDFEAFFLFTDYFYVFSKESKNFITLKIPNKTGTHVAELISTFKFSGKHNDITSAAISADGKRIYLLNHDKVWELSQFKNDAFFEGKISSIPFDHKTQKEGVCVIENKIYITDEFKKNKGGNLYELTLD